jgi:hypothetical protein
MSEGRPQVDYVFGYGSLVELRESLTVEGAAFPALAGRLRGFRRLWGAAMNNWETAADEKHYVDSGSARKPHVRVAFLDVEEEAGATVNGLAIPVDAARLAEFDAREVNYSRVDVSAAFEPPTGHRVYTYRATAGARARLEAGVAEGNLVASRAYFELVRRAFANLDAGALAEFERSTDPLPCPKRDLEPRPLSPDSGDGPQAD